MSVTAAIRKMLEAGLTVEQALLAAECFEQAAPVPALSKPAERMRRYREHRKANGLSVGFKGSDYVDALRARDGMACVYCEEETGDVVDHMVPISKGGTDDLDNLALACRACNCGKAGRMPGEDGYTLRTPSAQAAHVRYVREQANKPPQKEVPPHPPKKNYIPPSTPTGSQATPIRGKADRGATLPADWQPNDAHRAIVADAGLPNAFLAEQADRMRDWAAANRNRAVGRKADWDATFRNWLREAIGKRRDRPQARGDPPLNRPPSFGDLARQAEDRIHARQCPDHDAPDLDRRFAGAAGQADAGVGRTAQPSPRADWREGALDLEPIRPDARSAQRA